MNLSNYLVDANSMEGYGGQEQRAADNLNRIYRELDNRIYHLLIVGLESHYDPEKYHKMMDDVWDDWSNKGDALVNLRDEQIDEYIDSACETNTLFVCASDVCAEYSLNELEMMAKGVGRMIRQKG